MMLLGRSRMAASALLPLPLLLLLLSEVSSSSITLEDMCTESGEKSSTLTCAPRSMKEFSEALIGEEENPSVKRLEIRCTSTMTTTEFEEEIPNWGRLPGLEELTVVSCLGSPSYSGLKSLRKLTLRSASAEERQQSAPRLELNQDSFLGLTSLESLDLSLNGLWSLPEGALCRRILPSLQALNLSGNHLADLAEDLNLSSPECQLAEITELDLSGNQVGSLSRGDLSGIAGSVKRLDFSSNRISLLGDAVLDGMASLEDLDLSHNRLAALPMDLRCESLRTLSLQNNSIGLLYSGVFNGLEGLISLNLSRNAIASTHVRMETFMGLGSLQVLDLSHNGLAVPENELFKLLRELMILHLQGNGMQILAPRSFEAQGKLRALLLSNNKLKSLPKGILDGLRSLTALSMDKNELSSLPESLFDSVQELEELSLEENLLTRVPESVPSLQKLRTLDLGENLIEALEEGDLGQLESLYGLRLSGNRITYISQSSLANLTSLHVLNLARNRISKVDQGAFSGLLELRALRLDNNELADINGVVFSQGKLQWLNVSSNRLQWFDYASVPTSLEWLDIHDNQVEELGNYYKLGLDGFRLRTLDASHNTIKKLTKLSLPPKLEVIDLSGNEISEVEPKTFEDKERLSRVSLADNSISKLELSALYVRSAVKKGKNRKTKSQFALASARRNLPSK